MDSRSRTERYKELRDEVANEVGEVSERVGEFVEDVKETAKDFVVNESDKISSEYDRMLKEQEEFLKSLDEPFANVELPNIDETVATIEKSVREFFDQPFEKTLEDTIQTNIREIEEVNNSIHEFGYDDASVQEANDKIKQETTFPTNYDVATEEAIQPLDETVVEDVAVDLEGLNVETPKVEIEPIIINDVNLDEFQPNSINYEETTAPTVEFNFEEPTNPEVEIETPLFEEEITIPVVEEEFSFVSSENPELAESSYEESVYDDVDENQITIDDILENQAETDEVVAEVHYEEPETTQDFSDNEFSFEAPVEEIVVESEPYQEPETVTTDFAVPDSDDIDHPDMLEITAKLHELNVSENEVSNTDGHVDMPWMMASAQPTLAEDEEPTIQVPTIKEPDVSTSDTVDFDEIWKHVQENNEDLKDSFITIEPELPQEPVVEGYIEPTDNEFDVVEEVTPETHYDEFSFETTSPEVDDVKSDDYQPYEEMTTDLHVDEIKKDVIEEPVHNELPKVSSVFGPTEGIVNAGYTNPGLYKAEVENNAVEEQASNDEVEEPIVVTYESENQMYHDDVADLTSVLPTIGEDLQSEDYKFEPINYETPEIHIDEPVVEEDINIDLPEVDLSENIVDEVSYDVPEVHFEEPEIVSTDIPVMDEFSFEAPSVEISETELNEVSVDVPVIEPVVEDLDVVTPVVEQLETPEVENTTPEINLNTIVSPFGNVDNVLSDLPNVEKHDEVINYLDDANVEPTIENTENDLVFEDDIDRIINDVKSYNIEQGIRNDENTQVNIISELQKDEEFGASEETEEKKKGFFSGLFGGDTEELEVVQAAVTPNETEVTIPEVEIATTEQLEIEAEKNDTTGNEFLLEDEDEVVVPTVDPVEVASVEDVVVPQPQIQETAENQQVVSELTQQLEDEREARQAMFEQTQQLKLQISEHENELNEVTNNVSRTNRILNVILTLLIIALFVILIVIVFFFAQERGLI